jgi:ABC-2 type transport system permease protein
MNAARIAVVGGFISYRALFNWLPVGTFVPTMLLAPALQLVFFTYLGRYLGGGSDAFFVVGNAVQASALATVYGIALTVGNERYLSTLSSLLATPANRIALFMGRALPLIVNGAAVSIASLAVGALAFGVAVPVADWPALAAALAAATASGAAVGLVLGALALGGRDVFLLSNVVYSLLLILGNVNVPVGELPGVLQRLSNITPLRYATEGARHALSGGAVAAPVAHELALALAYASIAVTAVVVLERRGRRLGTLDTF